MSSTLLSNVLIAVFSFALRIPDRLLEMAWRAVMAVAPVRSIVRIDVNSLYAWNVLPYRSSNVPVSYAKLLKASHTYQEAVKTQQWIEVQDNFREIKNSTMSYLENEVDSIPVASYSSLILKTLRSLFRFIKAQQSFKASLSRVDLEEIRREKRERIAEAIAEE